MAEGSSNEKELFFPNLHHKPLKVKPRKVRRKTASDKTEEPNARNRKKILGLHESVKMYGEGGVLLDPAFTTVAGHIAVTFADKLIVFWGGYHELLQPGSELKPATTIRVYHPDSEKWFLFDTTANQETGSFRPLVTSGSCALIYRQSLFIFGGYIGEEGFFDLIDNVDPQLVPGSFVKNAVNAMFSLDLATMKWKLESQSKREAEKPGCISPMPTPRHKMAGFSFGNRLYFFGGYGPTIEECQQQGFHRVPYIQSPGVFFPDDDMHDSCGWNNQLLCFDPATRAWTSVECGGSVPSARAAAAIAKVQDGRKAVLFGGRHNCDRLDDLYLLDLRSMIWQQIDTAVPIPPGRSWHVLVETSPDSLTLYGGLNTETGCLADLWTLNTVSWEWRQLPSGCLQGGALKPRLWHTGNVIDGTLYAFGGIATNILHTNTRQIYCRDLLKIRPSPPSLQRLCIDRVTDGTGLNPELLGFRLYSKEIRRKIRMRVEGEKYFLRHKVRENPKRPFTKTIFSVVDLLERL